jgi:hypothetical protein
MTSIRYTGTTILEYVRRTYAYQDTTTTTEDSGRYNSPSIAVKQALYESTVVLIVILKIKIYPFRTTPQRTT